MTESGARTHEFTLILGGRPDLTEDVAHALFEAGCDDATLGTTCGVICLDFARSAGSFREAVVSAIANVHKADVGLHVLRVEPDELVTAAEVADRLGRSRESVRLLATGERGPGDFPPPVARVKARSPLYRWAEVARWAEDKMAFLAIKPPAGGGTSGGPLLSSRGGISALTLEEARTIGALNAALELRRYAQEPRDVEAFLSAVFQGRATTGPDAPREARDEPRPRRAKGKPAKR